ncbi:MAG: M1 family metallopeptidase [Candidatus Aminicenantes bacterium]|nr:M1 family metallopeptidase [Candidatus Aminicenantes bacterium]
MKKPIFVVFVFLFIFSLPCFAAMSKHIVDYRIKAKLVPEEKAIIGYEILTWLNNSDTPVSELQFHLYLNAFKNNRSTFLKERGGISQSIKPDKQNWGYNEIRKIKIKNGTDLTSAVEYIQPDDGNKDDQTVMRVLLPEPVLPHKKIILEIEFYAKLPKVFARAGFENNFCMASQWFPKIGVLQEGKWNCHQYHSHSEFFADFGVYEVEITVPEEYVVGATGKRVKEVSNQDGTKTYIYYQEDIHDFAWTACPDFVEFHESYSLEDPPVKTEIILLIHRSHLKLKKRYLDSLKNGIEFYSQNYGAYPYPTITLVDPPLKAAGAGGMEYPTLFTTLGAWFFPKGLLIPEMVTIHEFGHGYWYGMVASNEFEEPWLDEGINSYSEIKAMAKYYGEDRSMLNLGPLKISDFTSQRARVIGSGRLDPILKKSWEFYSGGSYGLNSYSKAALSLLMLERYLGEDIMAMVMKTYFERWKFKHPITENFIEVAEDVSKQDLGWFFDQFWRSPDKLDYAIGRLRSTEVKEPEGIFKGQYKTDPKDKEKNVEKIYKNEVSIIRKGELIFPQEVLIIFENGEEIREKWDGKDRWKKFKYLRPYKLKSAQIDPENIMILDINHMNNSRLMKPNKIPPLKYALELMLDFQKLLTWLGM